MAVRDDVYVVETVTPRLVVVEKPSTEITIQDLVDTLRNWEADMMNLDADKIIQAAGKDDLGGGVKVGVTATLLNAQLLFEARSTPLCSGSATSDNSAGTILTDTSATFVTDGVAVGDTVYNHTDKSIATVIEVISETQLRHFALGGGTDNQWQIGDEYLVYHNAQCNVSGGNLVAQDASGNSISPVAASANVQVVRTSSASATLQELQDIQYSSFAGGVWVDATSSYSGTDYPVGTPRQPVNNMTDALTIATERGFTKFYILGDITLDAGLNYQQFTFIGESSDKSTITVSDSADTYKCEFYECTLTGTLDGLCKVKNAVVKDLNYISGYIELCVLQGTIQLGGGATAYFLDCWAGTTLGNPPVIDLGGSGQTLVMQNFNGSVKWVNKSGTEEANASLNAGWVFIDSTVTAGSSMIMGVGTVTDNSGPEFTLDTTYLVSPRSVADATWEEAASAHNTAGTFGALLNFIHNIEGGRWKIENNQMVFYKSDNTTEVARFNLYDSDGSPSETNVYDRRRV